jgi:hypothetical protein
MTGNNVPPLWSVMIPTHDCAHYVGEALASVLAQDPGAATMQICVVDDASNDDPQSVVTSLGLERVEFFRQPANVGHARNFNTCIQLARGRLVHILHGDDAVRPGFYETMQAHFARHAGLGAAFCRQLFTDASGGSQQASAMLQASSGILADAARVIATNPLLSPPAMVVCREVYAALGGFDTRFTRCGEDLEMWVRIAAKYPIAFETEPLVLYRRHPQSLLSASLTDGTNIREARTAVAMLGSHFSPTDWDDVDRDARELIALWGVTLARGLARRGAARAALTQLTEALRTRCSPRVLRAALAVPPRLIAGLLFPRTDAHRVASKINSP